MCVTNSRRYTRTCQRVCSISCDSFTTKPQHKVWTRLQ